MVGTVHTATSDLLWSPHVHAIASRGGWDPDGVWHPVPYVDEKSAELLFRQKVITLLADEGLITPDRLQLLDSWKSGHTGFSAHHRVTVPAGDPAGLERLARYLLRAPLSLERLELEGSLARYRHKRAKRPAEELFDRHDLLARLLMHIPAPRLHVVRYYGHYASAARANRRRDADDKGEAATTSPKPSHDDPISSAHRRRLRRQWARMIRRVFAADPLLCDCGETMRVISFLTDPPVIAQILRHLENRASSTGSARAPPEAADRQQLAS
jgi:hypothetical protein